MNVILASQSPRRKELLGLLNIPFIIRVADIDETMNPGAAAYSEVARISRMKAMAIQRQPEDLVIAADTIVVCDGHILGKPRDAEEAKDMLRLLSGRDHQVMTGLTVLRGDSAAVVTEATDVHFRELSEGEIGAYVASGEPMDKAGAYGIQGGAALFCSRINGDYYNVVGLPVCRLTEIMKEMAPEWMGDKV